MVFSILSQAMIVEIFPYDLLKMKNAMPAQDMAFLIFRNHLFRFFTRRADDKITREKRETRKTDQNINDPGQAALAEYLFH